MVHFCNESLDLNSRGRLSADIQAVVAATTSATSVKRPGKAGFRARRLTELVKVSARVECLDEIPRPVRPMASSHRPGRR